MQKSKWLIEIALKELNMNQATLARVLDVSAGQVSRWRNHNDYMSVEMSDKIKRLCEIEDIPTELVFVSGSVENAKVWSQAISICYDSARECSESGYENEFNDPINHRFHIGTVLDLLGVTIAQKMTEDMAQILMGEASDQEMQERDEFWDEFLSIPVAKLIFEISTRMVDVSAFYYQFMFDLDHPDEYFNKVDDLEIYTAHLAALKCHLDPEVAVKAEEFRIEWFDFFSTRIIEIKDLSNRLNIPLKAELMDLLSQDVGDLADTVNNDVHGLSTQIHPDKYMNELLIGMRVIHQVLPAILKKLEIYDDFDLDTDAIYEGTPRLATFAKWNAVHRNFDTKES